MPGHSYGSFPVGLATSADKLGDLECIGCGGFGEVFKAKHVDWGTVAYKKLPQQFIKEQKAVKQMAKEIEILRSLRHRNIISISGIVFELGNYGILLEYMKYGGLNDFLDKLSVPLLYKVQLTLDVVLGMNYLHTLDKPIIHGDLKIQNVLVADGYLAKISDFGLSSWKDMSKTSSRSNGVCQGTVTHIPPERWLDINLPRTQTDDVYAYGILLWEIFTEDTPFSNACSTQISAVVQSGQRPDLAQLPKDLPPLIRSLMETSWHQDQSKRKPFKEIKEMLERYTSEEAKKIDASRTELQQQESLSLSQTSPLEYDGSFSALSLSDPLRQINPSVETNPDLPVTRNETGDRGATDVTNICMDLKEEVQANETSAAVVASSLCTGSHGNTREDSRHTEEAERRRGGGGGGGRGGGREEGSGPAAVATEASLCTGEHVMDINQLSCQLNIRPTQESNGQSVQVPDSLLASSIVQLRSNRTNDNHPSEAVAKNTTQPKTIDDLPSHQPNAAAAAAAAAEMRLSLQPDPPCQQMDDVKLRLYLSSSRSKSDAGLSSDRTLQLAPTDRCLAHSESVPEADATLSPETQRQPSSFPEENEQPSNANDAAQECNSYWNTGKCASDYNLDVSRGYYPKDGSSFQKHVHPDATQPLSPSQPPNAQHLFQPTVPSGTRHWGTTPPTEPTGFTINQPGGYNIPPWMNQPLPTSSEHMPLHRRMEDGGTTWNSLSRESKTPQEATSKPNKPSTIIVKNDDQEVTVIHSTGSGIQIGNNNTMIISENYNVQKRSRQKMDSRPHSPPSSSSSASSSAAGPTAHATGAAVNLLKSTVTKKIIVPDRLVDQESMVMVAEKIGKDWRSLARQLGFLEPDIDIFNIDYHQLGVKEVAYQMLRDWRERKGREAKMQVLAIALIAIKRPDIALELSTKTPANAERT